MSRVSKGKVSYLRDLYATLYTRSLLLKQYGSIDAIPPGLHFIPDPEYASIVESNLLDVFQPDGTIDLIAFCNRPGVKRLHDRITRSETPRIWPELKLPTMESFHKVSEIAKSIGASKGYYGGVRRLDRDVDLESFVTIVRPSPSAKCLEFKRTKPRPANCAETGGNLVMATNPISELVEQVIPVNGGRADRKLGSCGNRSSDHPDGYFVDPLVEYRMMQRDTPDEKA